MYAKIKNNVVVKYPYGWVDFEVDNNNTNYGSSQPDILTIFPDTDIAKQGFICVDVISSPQPIFDESRQIVSEGTPSLIDGVWKQTWVLTEMTDEQIAENEIRQKQDNKIQAMNLLQATDWTQMPDVTLVNKDAFTSYRTALRAIAVNPPVTVSEWPVKPEEVWPAVA